MDGFAERYSRAVRRSEELIRELGKRDGLAVERIASGTNLFRLRVNAGDPAAFRRRLAARGVMLPEPQRSAFLIGVNETLNRMSGAELSDAFARGLA